MLDSFLNWTSGDSDPADSVTYDVHFGITNPPPLLVSNHSNTSYYPGYNFGTKYYWQIVARDNWGFETLGPVWNFTTEDRLCGDIQMDGVINIADVTYFVSYLFQGGNPPQPYLCIGDLNCDGAVNLPDLTYMVAFLFGGGVPPCEECCNPLW